MKKYNYNKKELYIDIKDLILIKKFNSKINFDINKVNLEESYVLINDKKTINIINNTKYIVDYDYLNKLNINEINSLIKEYHNRMNIISTNYQNHLLSKERKLELDYEYRLLERAISDIFLLVYSKKSNNLNEKKKELQK